MPKKCVRCPRVYALEAFIDARGIERAQCEACRESGRKRFRVHYKANPGQVAKRISTYRTRDPEKRRAQKAKEARNWRQKHPAKKAAENRRYRKSNPGRVAALSLKRLERIVQATPPWANFSEIEKVYDRATRLRAEGHKVHVDHCEPLAGKHVCGLHVHFNMRIVSSRYNLKKSNKR